MEKSLMNDIMAVAAETCHCNVEDLSDGFHSFKDLYKQRLYLSAALVNAYPEKSWKSWLDENGEPWFNGDGWFLVCIETPAGPYSYHYEEKDWALFKCKELERAKPYDGHTSDDVPRLMSLA